MWLQLLQKKKKVVNQMLILRNWQFNQKASAEKAQCAWFTYVYYFHILTTGQFLLSYYKSTLCVVFNHSSA